MFKSTSVQPSSYFVENFGPEVQAITFSYAGVVHSINRRGKRNIKGFQSPTQGTYSLTNGTDKFLRMNLYKIDFISWTDTKGTTHDNFARI